MNWLDQILTANLSATMCDLSPQELAERKAERYNDEYGYLNERDGYDCAICRNKGDTMHAAEWNGVWTTYTVPCNCIKTRRSIKLMEKSGLKNVIQEYTFKKFLTDAAWQADIKEKAVAYANDPDGRWFFVGGQSGAGKTHLCTAICRKFLHDGKEVVYMLWRDEAVQIKAVANDADRYEELIQRFKNAEVLYIDDLFKTGKANGGGKQTPTAADVNLAFEILNYRYNKKLLTVISSECSVDDLLDIDEAVGGRIVERSVALNIAPDRRKNYRVKGVVTL